MSEIPYRLEYKMPDSLKNIFTSKSAPDSIRMDFFV